MKDHAQFAEDLALYAMGALDAGSCPELQAHLGTCGECRRELEALRGDVALLALSAAGPQPPERARERLMAALESKSGPGQSAPIIAAPPRRWPRWLFWAPLAACLLLTVHAVILVRAHQRAHRENEKLVKELADERTKNAQAREIIAMMIDPKAAHMTLVSSKAVPQPQVKTIYVPEKGHVLLIANNLPEPPADKAYELWLLPASGEPMPCGTFKTDWRGHGMMLHSMQTAGVNAKGFAVTLEPESGSQTPTLPIVLAPGQ
jgi:anti-sigma-K factor RskA